MRGFSLIETLVSFLLVFMIVSGVASVVSNQNRAVLRIRDEVESMESGRIVRFVLEGELRHALAGRDWTHPEGDTIGLRAFRGIAEICGSGVDERRLAVRYRGMRAPNIDKDSILVLLESGRWEARGLSRVDPSPPDGGGGDCLEDAGAFESPQFWTFDRSMDDAIFLRVFERGSYHLAAGAFRYRSGLAGRQPLTPERIDESRSRLSANGNTVEVVLHLKRGAAGMEGGVAERWRVKSAPGHP